MQAVKVSLQDEDRGEAVAHATSPATGEVCLNEDPLGLGAGEPLVEGNDGKGKLLLQRARKVERFAGHLSERPVHISRQANDRLGDMVLPCKTRKEGHILAKSAAEVTGKRTGQDSIFVRESQS